jgi:ligand-binding sensor domain-containing protein/signal transduction histidine kinase
MRCRWQTVVAVAYALTCSPVFALNPAYRISQYLHTAWKNDSGLQAVRRLAQTPDGYLWLATRGGLVRFDGFRFSTYRAGSVQGLESSIIQDLLVDPDGSLWIATLGGGISHYQGGAFHSYTIRDGLPSDDVQSLYRDTRGVIWVGTRDGKIARLARGRFENVSLGIPDDKSINGFVETADQSLWIATFGNGVFRLRDGVLTAFSVRDGLPDARVNGIYRDRSGKVWTAGRKGLSSWDGRRFVPYSAVNKSVDVAIGCREDRDGNLWIAAPSGLYRAQKDTVVKLNHDSGLSTDFASDVFEDRDGNLWVATRAGLDRLRDGPIRTFTAKEGLPTDSGPIVVGDHGAIWTAAEGRVDRIAASELSTWRIALPFRAQTITLLTRPGSEFLIGFEGGVASWHPRGAATTIPALAGLDVSCLLQARDGSIWIGTSNRGLLHWKSQNSESSIETVVSGKFIESLAEDHAGAIWVASYDGGLYRVTGKQVQRFGPSQGLKSESVYTAFIDEKGDLWIGSAGGLSWFQNGTLRTVSSRQGLPSDQVFAIVDDSYDRLWFATFAGIASLEKKSLTEWAEGRRDKLDPTVYRATDETQIYSTGRKFPNAVRSGDGHLWFSFALGVSEVVPPSSRASREDEFPVMVEDVRIDGIPHYRQDRLRIPAGTRSIEITYTAIALANPESVRFRYRLQGMDNDWIDADSRRTAFYNNLKPNTYKFTVSASAGAGQWREGPTLVLEQLPFFYQTMWFALLVLTMVLSLGILAYRVRLQQAVSRIQAGVEERMGERNRIAQELHDSVVQAISGSTMLVENAAEKVPDSLPVLKGTLLRAVDRLEAALAESRAALKGLRDTTRLENDLEKQLSAVAREANHQKIAFKLVITGETRDIRPMIRYEVFRIGSEAISNAFKHSEGTSIRVELAYVDGLRLAVQDNGRGIPAEVLHRGKDEHFGLQGIRERADRIGAKLAIYSRVGAGTEVGINVSEDIAFDTTGSNPSLVMRAVSRLRSLSRRAAPDNTHFR